ncbi:hypothetical protein THIOM_002802 [Candidatus Thiomargarita nelsonii]|uniref:Uncharacterized protein n=1 Tax=Candidatus Thiomargarita nelsonii TaxID=1003181 RepID=A0A176S089_9GAMM|nr:hypothetical protein THIOM_002802 [Candidatus Thiomargarita nelsonii]
MALKTDHIATFMAKLRRIDNIRFLLRFGMTTAWPMARFTSNISFSRHLGFNIKPGSMTSFTQF